MQEDARGQNNVRSQRTLDLLASLFGLYEKKVELFISSWWKNRENPSNGRQLGLQACFDALPLSLAPSYTGRQRLPRMMPGAVYAGKELLAERTKRTLKLYDHPPTILS